MQYRYINPDSVLSAESATALADSWRHTARNHRQDEADFRERAKEAEDIAREWEHYASQRPTFAVGNSYTLKYGDTVYWQVKVVRTLDESDGASGPLIRVHWLNANGDDEWRNMYVSRVTVL